MPEERESLVADRAAGVDDLALVPQAMEVRVRLMPPMSPETCNKHIVILSL